MSQPTNHKDLHASASTRLNYKSRLIYSKDLWSTSRDQSAATLIEHKSLGNECRTEVGTWCWSSGRTSSGRPPATATWFSGTDSFGDGELTFCSWWCSWSCSVSALRLWFCCRKSNAASVFFCNIFSCCPKSSDPVYYWTHHQLIVEWLHYGPV